MNPESSKPIEIPMVRINKAEESLNQVMRLLDGHDGEISRDSESMAMVDDLYKLAEKLQRRIHGDQEAADTERDAA